MSSSGIKRGAILSYVAILVNIVATLLYTPWMIRKIGKADYGLYVLMTSMLTYFVVDYGLGQVVTRMIANYRSTGKTSEIDRLLGVTARLYLLLDLVVVAGLVVVYFLIDHFFEGLTPVELSKLKQIYGIAALFSALSFPLLYLNGIYNAFELFAELRLADLASKLMMVLLTVAVLLFDYGLVALVVVYSLVPFITNLAKYVYLKRKGHLSIDWKFWDHPTLKQILNTSFWLLLILVGELLLKNLSPTLLGMFSGAEEIAVFSIANNIDFYFMTIAVALSGLFLPRISFMVNQANEVQQVENLMTVVGRIQVLLLGFITLALILVGDDFILLWVGESFRDSYYVVLLLIIPSFLFSLSQIGTSYLLVVDKLSYQAWLYLLAAVANMVLAYFLIPDRGAIGVGISVFASKLVFYVLGFLFIFHYVLKLNMIRFCVEVFRNLTLPLAAIVVLYLVYDHFTFSQVSYTSFLIDSSVLLILFGVWMYRLYLNQQEKEMLAGLVKQLRRKTGK